MNTLLTYLAEAKQKAQEEDPAMGQPYFGGAVDQQNLPPTGDDKQVTTKDADGTEDRDGPGIESSEVINADAVINQPKTMVGTPGDILLLNPTIEPSRV